MNTSSPKRAKVLFRGKEENLWTVCKEHAVVKPSIAYNRYKLYKWPIEEALGLVKHKSITEEAVALINGKRITASILSKTAKINILVAAKRIVDFNSNKISAKEVFALGLANAQRSVSFQGETHTISEWAKVLGISKSTMTARIRLYDKGAMPIESVFSKGLISHKDRYPTYNTYDLDGVKLNLKQFAVAIGIAEQTVSDWKAKGMTTEEIIAHAAEFDRTRQRHILVNGEDMTVQEAERRFGIASKTIFRRLYVGWSDTMAATRPLMTREEITEISVNNKLKNNHRRALLRLGIIA